MMIKQHRTDILERVYMAIIEYWSDNQLPPSFDELTRLLHYSSKSNIFNYVKELVELGYLEVPEGKWRSIRVVGSTWTPPNVTDTLKLIKNKTAKKAILL
jgi:SOS-response transcriptional repressor LexA